MTYQQIAADLFRKQYPNGVSAKVYAQAKAYAAALKTRKA